MNYIGIRKKIALYLMVSTSFLRATTTNKPPITTICRANLIHKYFDSINKILSSVEDAPAEQLNALEELTKLKRTIKALINFDENIINQRAPNPKGFNETILKRVISLGDTDISKILLTRRANIENKANSKKKTKHNTAISIKASTWNLSPTQKIIILLAVFFLGASTGVIHYYIFQINTDTKA